MSRSLLDIISDFIDIKNTLDSPRMGGWMERVELSEEIRKLEREVEEWLSTRSSSPKSLL